ncbi:MAG: Gfo/Idh/MocA family oxidoreductase [Verrucomicrobiota bacterium]|nr:Gfo/Idh/MocA family oxidoreductase [Verrucomicrobiota bacterium]
MHKSNQPEHSPTRREFLKSSSVAAGTVALAPYLLSSRSIFAANSDTLKVGLIGCGGRGSGAAAQALAADKNVILTAMGDAFPDRLESSLKSLQQESRDRVHVTPEKRFTGLDAYQKVIDSGVDVVLLATPPGFRPAHLKAAIAAGKHVFCEKPMAVDGPGVRSVLESAEQAKQKKLSLVAGFCWRYNYGERAIMKQIHDGAIGDIRAIQTTYNTGPIWVKKRMPGQTDVEYQLRNWYYFTWLSGDHIAEQAVHSIDKMSWAMRDVMPLRAMAHGGRQVRTGEEFGHIYDHFSVVYEYENGARGYHFCRQQAGTANDNSDYIMGSRGIARIKAFGPLEISGENPWRFRGERPDMYQVEHNELFASIRKGEPINDGVWMARSTLLAILGRMAAYTGQIITTEQALNSEEVLGPQHFDWNTPLPNPPVPMPGQTKFV